MSTATKFSRATMRRGPKIPDGLVRVSKTGSDIVIPFELLSEVLGRDYNAHSETEVKAFTPEVNADTHEIRLQPVTSITTDIVRPYVTSRSSRSVVITCRTLLSKVGRPVTAGDYAARAENGALIISFARAARRAS
jgi:hypothetical protein